MTDFKFQKVVVILLVGLGAVFAVNKAMQPNLDLLTFTAKGEVAYGNGYTDDRSVDPAIRFFSANPQVKTLVLQNMSGTHDIDMNLRIARAIRGRGLATHLERGSYIASGAVDLFLAGKTRTMACGARIGVHSWSGGNTYHPANLKTDPRQKTQEKFLREMGIDPAFYVFTREAALPDDIYILTDEDIERFGLLTEPGGCLE